MPKTTAPTPDQAGHWVVSEFGLPSVLKWETFDPLPEPPIEKSSSKSLLEVSPERTCNVLVAMS